MIIPIRIVAKTVDEEVDEQPGSPREVTPNIKFLKNVWKSHIDHHFRDSTKGYGVSSAFWDRVFGILQKPKKPLKTA